MQKFVIKMRGNKWKKSGELPKLENTQKKKKEKWVFYYERFDTAKKISEKVVKNSQIWQNCKKKNNELKTKLFRMVIIIIEFYDGNESLYLKDVIILKINHKQKIKNIKTNFIFIFLKLI